MFSAARSSGLLAELVVHRLAGEQATCRYGNEATVKRRRLALVASRLVGPGMAAAGRRSATKWARYGRRLRSTVRAGGLMQKTSTSWLASQKSSTCASPTPHPSGVRTPRPPHFSELDHGLSDCWCMARAMAHRPRRCCWRCTSVVTSTSQTAHLAFRSADGDILGNDVKIIRCRQCSPYGGEVQPIRRKR